MYNTPHNEKLVEKRVLLSCGLQESACGPHGLPTDSLFLTNLRTPKIFFSSCFTAAQLLLSKSWFAIAKIRESTTTTNMRYPNLKFLKITRDYITLYSSLFMLIAALLLKLDIQAYK